LDGANDEAQLLYQLIGSDESVRDDSSVDSSEEGEGDPCSLNAIRHLESGATSSFSDSSGWKWTTQEPVQQRRASKANILRRRSGPTAIAKEAVLSDQPETSLWLFLDERMRDKIISATNDYCHKHHVHEWKDLTAIEFCAFLGLIIHLGANLWRSENLRYLWSDTCPIGIYRATMSRTRFLTLLRYIRFEEQSVVDQEREKGNRMAHILWLWNAFVGNLQRMYVPGENLSLDEMLSLFRGRTFLLVFIKSKPGKYGFKIYLVTDADNRYVCNATIFIPRKQGNVTVKGAVSMGGRPVKDQVNDLLRPYFGSGRNVTMDRYFSDLENSEYLLQQQITVIGTVMYSRRHVPKQLKVIDNR
jgi:hypothetical protein